MARKRKKVSSRCGKMVCFHGAFKSRGDARAKQKQTKGSRIIYRRAGRSGDYRHVVVTKK